MMREKGKRIVFYILSVIFLLIAIGVDRVTKYLAVTRLKDSAPYVIIDGVFELRYLENRGAAFGMLQNRQLLFLFIAFLMVLAALYFFLRVPLEKKYTGKILLILLIVSGGIGNTIDRMQSSYVIDFLYFKLIDFPIFNVADMYVTVSTVLLFFNLLIFTKDEDLDFLKFRIRKDV